MFQIEVFIKCRSHLYLPLSYPTSQDLFGLWLIVNTVIIFLVFLDLPSWGPGQLLSKSQINMRVMLAMMTGMQIMYYAVSHPWCGLVLTIHEPSLD